MGSLSLPSQGLVYLDANCIIYSVEGISPYKALLDPVWQGARSGAFRIVTSELTLLETLVLPLKSGNKLLENNFRQLLLKASDIQLFTVTRAILTLAAQLRATTSLKTPDAIHAATAVKHQVALFITNDGAFRQVSQCPVSVLHEIAAQP